MKLRISHHNSSSIRNTGCNILMRKDETLINKHFILYLNIFSYHTHSFNSYPLPYNTLPPNYTPSNKCVILNLRSTQYTRIRQSHSLSNHTILPYSHIRPYYTIFIHLSCWMNQYISNYIISLLQIFATLVL